MKNVELKEFSKFTLVKEKVKTNVCKVNSCESAATLIRELYKGTEGINESFFALFLDRGNAIIGYAKISQGGRYSTCMDSTIVAKYAVSSLAVSVILAHNHPSGRAFPSVSDEKATNDLKRGLNYLNIKLLDHIIITEDDHYSFAEENLL